MLTCTNLSMAFQGKEIFHQLGFTLGPGTLLYLHGPNGSGKTTLLKMLTGLLTPTAGTICWNGAPIAENRQAYLKHVQYCGHKNAIKPQLTVLENLRFWAKLHGTPELLQPAIHYFDLGNHIDTPCALLSAGWKKRVALARMFTCFSDLWLLDEPDTHLDVHSQAMLANIIQTRVEQGGIVIVATHKENTSPLAPTLNMGDYRYDADMSELFAA